MSHQHDDLLVRNVQIEVLLEKLAKVVARDIPAGWGFALIISELKSPESSVFYTSNCSRDDMILTLEKILSRLKELER